MIKPTVMQIVVTDLTGGTYSSVHALVGACLVPSGKRFEMMWSEMVKYQ